MAHKKSFFEDNPALNFISRPEEAQQPSAAKQAPEGYKRDPQYIETKSKRLQLLVQPSLHAKVKALAVKRGLSVNELVHSILEEATGGTHDRD